jgi:hypothetical protein
VIGFDGLLLLLLRSLDDLLLALGFFSLSLFFSWRFSYSLPNGRVALWILVCFPLYSCACVVISLWLSSACRHPVRSVPEFGILFREWRALSLLP